MAEVARTPTPIASRSFVRSVTHLQLGDARVALATSRRLRSRTSVRDEGSPGITVALLLVVVAALAIGVPYAASQGLRLSVTDDSRRLEDPGADPVRQPGVVAVESAPPEARADAERADAAGPTKPATKPRTQANKTRRQAADGCRPRTKAAPKSAPAPVVKRTPTGTTRREREENRRAEREDHEDEKDENRGGDD